MKIHVGWISGGNTSLCINICFLFYLLFIEIFRYQFIYVSSSFLITNNTLDQKKNLKKRDTKTLQNNKNINQILVTILCF